MLIRRGYRYRIYPTPEVEKTLLEWERSHRFVWNVGLSDRLLRRKHIFDGEKFQWVHIAPSNYLRQQAKLTLHRGTYDWLRAAPCRSEQGVLRQLDAAWQMWQKDTDRGLPKFKRNGDSVGMPVAVAPDFCAAKHIRDGEIRIPKIGWVAVNIHRPLCGEFDKKNNPWREKTLSIVREGDEWFVSIMCEIDIEDPGRSSLPVIGIDRGVTINIADSSGRMARLPSRIRKLSRRVDRLKAANDQAKLKNSGSPRSSNWEKRRAQISKLEKRARRMRRYWLHEQALYYATNYSVVVVEDLKIKNMTKSAKGSAEEPGRKVKQKSGLNRSILEQGWMSFVQMLCYKMEERGGIVVKVPPHHTSQTCSICGHTSPDNRRSQSKFKCVACDYQENADVNAARTILQRFVDGKFEKEGGYRSQKAPKHKLRLMKRTKTAIPRGKGPEGPCPPEP